MITYIYFVKCPNCEDEHFDFFDDAKDYAMGCMSQKPIITQTEVTRNDFGECTDHCDLGTVWSWEDAVGSTEEPTEITFNKGDVRSDYDPEVDPEFQEDDDFRLINEELLENCQISFTDKAEQKEFFDLCSETGMYTAADLDRFMKDHDADDSNVLDKLRAYKTELDNVDNDFDITESVQENRLATNSKGDYLVHAASGRGYTVFNRSDVAIGGFSGDNDEEAIERFELGDITESCGKPIPEGMTIEELVEEMEENEDTVECTWCNDLFDKSECRKEVDLGWLCSRCEMAIKSRGETLTFREGGYWDFLDEHVSIEDVNFDSSYPDKIVVIDKPEDGGKWFAMFDINNGNPISYICAKDEDTAIDQIPYLVHGNIEDIAVEEVAEDELAEIEELAGSSPKKEVPEVHDLGTEYDGGYPEEDLDFFNQEF